MQKNIQESAFQSTYRVMKVLSDSTLADLACHFAAHSHPYISFVFSSKFS